ncbi:spectrin repeat-containing protein [Cryptosporidium canis]|nr:spectrin repeat-containing protein [Cryptosporidium canis]
MEPKVDSSKTRKIRYEKAIETGLELLRSALSEKENELRMALLELKESELGLKRREADLMESLRVFEIEKKNNEYLRILSQKSEEIFNTALENLTLKEKKISSTLDLIISEFNLELPEQNQDLDIFGKLNLIKEYVKKVERNEQDLIEYSKNIPSEHIGRMTGRCDCGYPVFVINGELIAGCLPHSQDNSSQGHDGVDMDFKVMELDWERKAFDHTREQFHKERLKLWELLRHKEEVLQRKSDNLNARLREVERIERIWSQRTSGCGERKPPHRRPANQRPAPRNGRNRVRSMSNRCLRGSQGRQDRAMMHDLGDSGPSQDNPGGKTNDTLELNIATSVSEYDTDFGPASFDFEDMVSDGLCCKSISKQIISVKAGRSGSCSEELKIKPSRQYYRQMQFSFIPDSNQ